MKYTTHAISYDIPIIFAVYTTVICIANAIWAQDCKTSIERIVEAMHFIFNGARCKTADCLIW